MTMIYLLLTPLFALADQPVAIMDTITTGGDTPIEFIVLGNDTGLGDVPPVVTVDTPPGNGSVEVRPGNRIEYTPNNNFSGSDDFIYTVTDADGDSASATVAVTVNANAEPKPVIDFFFTERNTPASFDVLANDTGLRDTPILVQEFIDISDGDVTVEADGTLTYMPPVDGLGNDLILYQARDADNDSGVTVVVVGINQEIAERFGSFSFATELVDIHAVGWTIKQNDIPQGPYHVRSAGG